MTLALFPQFSPFLPPMAKKKKRAPPLPRVGGGPKKPPPVGFFPPPPKPQKRGRCQKKTAPPVAEWGKNPRRASPLLAPRPFPLLVAPAVGGPPVPRPAPPGVPPAFWGGSVPKVPGKGFLADDPKPPKTSAPPPPRVRPRAGPGVFLPPFRLPLLPPTGGFWHENRMPLEILGPGVVWRTPSLWRCLPKMSPRHGRGGRAPVPFWCWGRGLCGGFWGKSFGPPRGFPPSKV